MTVRVVQEIAASRQRHRLSAACAQVDHEVVVQLVELAGEHRDEPVVVERASLLHRDENVDEAVVPPGRDLGTRTERTLVDVEVSLGSQSTKSEGVGVEVLTST